MSTYSDGFRTLLVNSLIISTLLQFLVTHHVSGVSIAQGKEFLLSTPALVTSQNLANSGSRLSFHFMSQESVVRIKLRVKWKTSAHSKTNSNFDFNFTQFHIFEVDPVFQYSKKQGRRWTFHVEGSHFFGLLVHMVNGRRGFETFVAVPVTGWGRSYFLVTLGYSVILMTKEGPNQIYFSVRIELKKHSIRIGNDTYEDGEIWRLDLNSFQAFAVSHCEDDNFVGAITGSHVRGSLPFGVVTGNCLSQTDNVTCDMGLKDANVTSNTVAEMLLPEESCGKEFILLNMTLFGGSGYHIILSSSDYTIIEVRLTSSFRLAYSYSMKAKGTWILLEALFGYLTSNKRVQVTYFHKSSCQGNKTSFPSLSLIIPVELFYFKYLCSVTEMQGTTHRLVYVVERRYSDSIRSVNLMNTTSDACNSFYQQSATWTTTWLVMSATVAPSNHFIVYSTQSPFGCYVFGQGPWASYMHPAGFMSSPINANCTKTINRMRSIDLIDNDCDGRIDEETRNQKDDDGDELIDEDLNVFSDNESDILLAYPNTEEHVPATSTTPSTTPSTTLSQRSTDYSQMPEVNVATKDCTMPFYWGDHCRHSCRHCLTDCNKLNGSCDGCYPGFEDPELGCTTGIIGAGFTVKGKYHPWLTWHCIQDCSEHNMVRTRSKDIFVMYFCLLLTRLCKYKTTCQGDIIEKRPGNCYRTMCPKDCQPYTWGVDCAHSCVNCGDDCNKFNGTCSYCKSGFKGSNSSCTQVCGYNEYGVNCRGNCRAICGEDCMDRKEGLCHEFHIDFQMLAASLSLMAVLLAIIVYCYLCCKMRQEEQIIQKTLSVTFHEGSRGQLNRYPSRTMAPLGGSRTFSQSSFSPRLTASGRLPPSTLQSNEVFRSHFGSASNLRVGSNVDPQRVQYARDPPGKPGRYSASRAHSTDTLRRLMPAQVSLSRQSQLQTVQMSRSAPSVRVTPALK
ncbi:hypothetical protein Btru_014752 [Bulinus truncatus]|nr:hypothetical protein Btru_014752 [Bulinus truncatus]